MALGHHRFPGLAKLFSKAAEFLPRSHGPTTVNMTCHFFFIGGGDVLDSIEEMYPMQWGGDCSLRRRCAPCRIRVTPWRKRLIPWKDLKMHEVQGSQLIFMADKSVALQSFSVPMLPYFFKLVQHGSKIKGQTHFSFCKDEIFFSESLVILGLNTRICRGHLLVCIFRKLIRKFGFVIGGKKTNPNKQTNKSKLCYWG